MKITVLDGHGLNPGDLSWDGFASLGDLTVYDRTAPDKVVNRSTDGEVLITNKTVLDRDIISALPKLKYIGVLATGYNVVDTEAATEKGVIVTNIPAYSTMSVAQRVFSLLLAVTDRSEHYAMEVREGKWAESLDFCYWNTSLIELAGKKIGIIGLGNIGKAVAKIADAFGMKVLAYTSKDASVLPDYIRKEPLESLWSQSDVISLHCPLTPDTNRIVNPSTISQLKEGVILINTGRGGLIDEEAVAEALHHGKIGAYCADVLSSEPPSPDNPLMVSPNVFLTPHIAWATKEARERLMHTAVTNLEAWLQGKPQNVVN